MNLARSLPCKSCGLYVCAGECTRALLGTMLTADVVGRYIGSRRERRLDCMWVVRMIDRRGVEVVSGEYSTKEGAERIAQLYRELGYVEVRVVEH